MKQYQSYEIDLFFVETDYFTVVEATTVPSWKA